MISDKPDDYLSPPLLDVLYNETTISLRVQEMAHRIVQDMGGDCTVIALLKGSFVFAADLVRAMHGAGSTPQIDFMTLSSYGSGQKSRGAVTIIQDIAYHLGNKPVLLVDDILESGQTLHKAVELLKQKGAGNISVCVLLDKPGKRIQPMEADYVGFTVPDRFVVGYGLDYAGYYRELPFIGAMPLS